MLDDTFLALIAAPIPGEAPTGRNMRYDEPFTSIESEVGKLDNPAAGEPDWKRIVILSREVLSSHSKDLLAASWATYAGLRLTRLSGLAIGLAGCRDLLTTYWSSLFPAVTRIKARRSALEWLGERASAAVLPSDAASPEGQAALDRCLAVLEDLEKVATERFEGEDGGLGALRRVLRDLRAPATGSLAAPSAVPAATSAGAASFSASGPVSGAPAYYVPVAAGPIASRAEAMAKLSEIADFFQRNEPHSPMGFLLARAVTWNSKSFQEVMLELLRNRDDAQRQVFDDLGLKLPPKPK